MIVISSVLKDLIFAKQLLAPLVDNVMRLSKFI